MASPRGYTSFLVTESLCFLAKAVPNRHNQSKMIFTGVFASRGTAAKVIRRLIAIHFFMQGISVMTLRARVAFSGRDSVATKDAASKLADLGFRILSVTQRGITIEGQDELFSTVFQSPLIENEDSTKQFRSAPTIPASLGKDFAVYFPTPPERCERGVDQ